MLFEREDLRSRLIRLIGQGRISVTTRAMDDAADRVSRYLRMQLLVNVIYGVGIAIALYFIGVPNAVLWGAFGTVLRFIPYVGPWVAALLPTLLALAVSPGWTKPILTVALLTADRTDPEQRSGAVALRRTYGHLIDRADNRGGFLDVAVGAARFSAGYAANGLPGGDGSACADVFLSSASC